MKTNSKLRERLREATCEAILQAAEEVFAEEGVQTARVESIAQRAGTSVGTLYTHFKDRDGILAGLLEARRAELMVQLDETFDRVAAEPLRVRLREVFSTLLGHFQEHRTFFTILMQGEMLPVGHRGAIAVENTRQTLVEMRDRVARDLARAVEEGVLRPELADLYPSLFVGVLKSTLVLDLVRKPKLELKSRAEQLVSFFLDGGGVKGG